MKTDSHDSVCVVKCLLHTVTMMNVNVQIEYSWIHSQELQDTHNDIVNVAKPTCFCLFSMMITPWPIDNNVTQTCHNCIRCVNTPPYCQLTKVIQPIKPRTIERLVDLEQCLQFRVLPDLSSLLVLHKRYNLILFTRNPCFQILDIFWIVEWL